MLSSTVSVALSHRVSFNRFDGKHPIQYDAAGLTLPRTEHGRAPDRHRPHRATRMITASAGRCIYVCMCVCVYICMHVCIFVCILLANGGCFVELSGNLLEKVRWMVRRLPRLNKRNRRVLIRYSNSFFSGSWKNFQ